MTTTAARVPDVDDVDTAKATFRGPEVCALAGITYRQLDYWTRTDLIQASVADAKGSGTHRLYSGADVAVTAAIRRLLDENPMNSRLQLARKIAPIIRAVVDNGDPDAVLAITSDDAFVVTDEQTLLDLARRHHTITVLTGFEQPGASA